LKNLIIHNPFNDINYSIGEIFVLKIDMKSISLILAMVMILLSFSCVCAQDVSDFESNDTDTISSTDSGVLQLNANDDVLESGEGTFTQLAGNISAQSSSYTLTKDYAYNSTVDGDYVNGIVINKDFTIDGDGHSISGSGAARIFNVSGGTVTLKNINICDGKSYNAGAILFGENTVGTLDNCTFTNNGGAVVFNGDATVTNCNFTKNVANFGGALYFKRAAVVNACNFADNSAGLYGGAVYFNGNSRNTLDNCNFTNNAAYYSGGAVFFQYAGAVNACIFSDNSAIYGGALYFYKNSNVSNSSFSHNSARGYGGAVYFAENTMGNLDNCNFTGNAAFADGGAVCFKSGGSVSDCNFNFNNASSGSAIHYYWPSSTKIISNSTFLNNRANSDSLSFVRNNVLGIKFTGNDNLINAIYSEGDVTFSNVTYWGANGIVNTDSRNVSRSKNEAGQNITLEIYIDGVLKSNDTLVSDADGFVNLSLTSGNLYKLNAYHIADSYYAASNNATLEFKMGSYTDLQSMIDVCSGDTLYLPYNITFDPDYDLSDENPYHDIIDFSQGMRINKTLKINGNAYTIDALSAARIFDVTGDNVVLNNISFVNAYGENGGAVYFNATGSVMNCNFTNNTAQYDGNAIYIENAAVKILNSTFTDNGEDTGYAIFNKGNLTLNSNNVSNIIYNDGNITSLLIATLNDNKTLYKNIGDEVVLNATLTDGDSNAIYDPNFIIAVNGSNVTNIAYDKSNRLYTSNYTFSSAGDSIISTLYDNNNIEISIGVYKDKINVTLTVLADSIHIGENATVDVTLPFDDAGGNMGIGEEVVPVVNGTARAVLRDLALGNHTFDVIYSGDNKYNPNQTEVKITVNLRDASVSVNNETLNLFIDENFAIVATTTPEGLNVTFVPDDSGVYTVDDNGLVTALKEGTGSILVKIVGDGIYVENSTVVNVSVSLKDASVSADDVTLFINETANINAVTLPEGLEVEYAVANESVATVDANGTITPLKAGTTDVTITIKDDSIHYVNSTTIDVTVNKITTSIDIEDPTIALFVGDNVSSGALLIPGEAGELSYVSDNESVAFVENGVIYAKAKGYATITVSFNGNDIYAAAKNKNISVSVQLEDVSVSADDVTLYINETAKINASTVPEGLSLEYEIEDLSVIAVDENGTITPLKAGSTQVTIKNKIDGIHDVESVTINVTVNKLPSSIELSNETLTLNVGENISSGATLIPAGAGELSYVSSNESVAIVENGNIIALAEGNTVITVSFEGNDNYTAAEDKTIDVTVSLNDASVSVNNETLNLLIDDNFTIVATTSPEGLNVTFVPDNSGVVSVDDNGIVTALKEGNATIAVKVGGDGVYAENTTEVSVTVSKVPTEISVANDTVDMEVLDEIASGATLTPADAGNVTYTVSNSSVVRVEDDKIVALAEGSAVITVSFEGDNKYAACESKTISVTVSLRDASVSADDVTLVINETANINAVTLPEGLEVEYAVADESVVTVDANGTITPLKVGTTDVTITIKADGIHFVNSTTIAVTVNKITTSIDIENPTIALFVGDNVSSGALLIPGEAGELTYVSSNESVAFVENGVIFAKSKGYAIITVSYDGNDIYAAAKNKDIIVSVQLEDASVSADDVTLYINETAKINASTVPEGLSLEYEIEDLSVIAVDENGTITPLKAGSTQVTIKNKIDGIHDVESVTINVTVNKLPSSIELSNETLTLNVGENISSGATLIPAGAGELSYVSSNESVAIVENGNIIALAEGNAVITVSFAGSDNYTAAEDKTIDVTVFKITAEIKIDAPAITEGENATVTVTLPGDATGTVTVGNEVVSLKNGTASVILTNLPVGNTTLPVTYSGDDKYNPIESNVTVTVNEKPAPPKENLTITASADPITVGENVTIIVVGFEDATGNVTAEVGNDVYTAPIVDGSASFTVSGLIENTTAFISYAGDDRYNNASTSVDIVVNPKEKENATISIDAPAITKGENATVTVTLPVDATGNITASVAGETYVAPVENGTATLIIPDLAAGNYTIPVTYSGDEKYSPVTEDVNLSVDEDKSVIISALDVCKYYMGSERFVVNVTDAKGNALANKSVEITINDVTYNRTTNENGTCSLALNLNAGVYNVGVCVDNKTINSTVSILTTVIGIDLVKVFRNESQYYATFLDSEGNYLPDGTMVRFNIHGIFYDRYVRGNEGLARLNINLEQGEYIITAMNLQTGEMSSNNITVISRIIENYNLTKYYRNASQYTVKLIGEDGKAVGAGESVTFNINGVFYTRTTDESCIAKLNINLEPGEYIITATYAGCSVSNKITVLPILSANDLVKKYGSSDQFVANLVGGEGKPYYDQKILFNINGLFYYRATDSSGNAKLNINLMPGEYIITSSYDGCNIANKITVLS